MKLDISCIRAILFTVEKYETLYDPVSFDDTKYDYYSDYLSEYDTEQILYHVQYCIKANLLSDVSGSKAWGHTQFDCCLEPLGHELLPIRELKKIGNILNRFSIKSVVQVLRSFLLLPKV